MAHKRTSKTEVVGFVSILTASLTILFASDAAAQTKAANEPYAASAMSMLQSASGLKAPLFQPAEAYDTGGPCGNSAAVADVNGDGKPDLLVANGCPPGDEGQTGSVGVLLGNGDGTFRAVVTYSSGGGRNALSIAVADVNGDGKPDLVVANSCADVNSCLTAGVGVLLGNGDGTFQAAHIFDPGGGYGGHKYYVVVADVNGDGKPDLVVADADAGLLGVLLGNGDGTFQPAVGYDSGGEFAYSVAVDDVNGDGKPDLVVAKGCADGDGCLTGGVGVLLGNGDGTFRAVVTYSSGGFNAIGIAIRDVNGDGKPDITVTNWCVSSTDCLSGSVGVLLGNGDGTFQSAATYGSGGVYALALAIGDMNGDGLADLVVLDCEKRSGCGDPRFHGALGVLLGDGDGTFKAAIDYDSGPGVPGSVVIADVNGDGNPDLVVANRLGSTRDSSVDVLLNKTSFCTALPAVTLSTTPTSLWPPNGKMIPVTVSGTISDTGCTVTSAAYAVTDEYGQVQPSGAVTLGAGGAYSFTVLLQASRLGNDLDGRHYTITVSASNNAGKTGSQANAVIVPHDQGH